MTRYNCPSCGARYNGKRCRACYYENFSEEIPHGTHVHKGEPLVIDAPARRPIPRKDPFGCEKTSGKPVFPKREKKSRPFAGLFSIFLLIYSLLPMVRDWGLQLEARESASQMEIIQSEELVEVYRQKPIVVYIPREELRDLTDGIKIWVQNDSSRDIHVDLKQASANGFVMENASLQIRSSGKSWGMGTLYLNETPPGSADGKQTVTFSMTVLDDLDMVLLETIPISLIRE